MAIDVARERRLQAERTAMEKREVEARIFKIKERHNLNMLDVFVNGPFAGQHKDKCILDFYRDILKHVASGKFPHLNKELANLALSVEQQ